MSLSVRAIDALVAAGATAEMLAAAMKAEIAAEEERKVSARLAAKLRKQKQRAKVTDVTRDMAGRSVTECDIAGHGVTQDAPAPVHTRGENNLSRLVDKPNLTTPNFASEPDLDWPDADKPSRAYLDQLEGALLEAVGPALASAAVAPKVKVLAPILNLGRAGQGPPCDLQADVLPTIRARAARSAAGSIKSWDFFRDACLEARDRRLAGAPAMGEVVALARGRDPPSSLTERIGADSAEAKRRALEQLSAQNG